MIETQTLVLAGSVDFIEVAEETLDSLPQEFRSRIQNVAILVEDFPPNQSRPRLGQQRRLLLGIFHGVPARQKNWYIPVLRGNDGGACCNDAALAWDSS